jgi:hypothetical protein
LEQSQKLELAYLTRLIDLFQQASIDLKSSSLQSLPMEMAIVKASEFGPVQPAPAQPVIIAEAGRSSNPEALNSIVTFWPQILEKTKEYNHSLISTLKLAQPVAVAGSDLVLVVPYKFHKDTLEARKNRIVIDQVVEEVSGLKLITKAILSKDWAGPLPQNPAADTIESETEGDLVQSALKIMGGEVESQN